MALSYVANFRKEDSRSAQLSPSHGAHRKFVCPKSRICHPARSAAESMDLQLCSHIGKEETEASLAKHKKSMLSVGILVLVLVRLFLRPWCFKGRARSMWASPTPAPRAFDVDLIARRHSCGDPDPPSPFHLHPSTFIIYPGRAKSLKKTEQVQ